MEIRPLFWIVFILCTTNLNSATFGGELDILRPYPKGRHHDVHRTHRYVRSCNGIEHGNLTHEFVVPEKTRVEFHVDYTSRHVNTSKFIDEKVFGHHAVVKNPLEMISVLVPEGGGCASRSTSTVSDTSSAKHCDVAINAGFFDNGDDLKTHGNCLGNIISNFRIIRNSDGVQNANFGIRKDGTVVIGYLSEDEVTDTKNPFIQLVSGVGWILRNGKSYVKESLKAECKDTQSTGTLEYFFKVKSARSAIGFDDQGHVHLVTFDGKTGYHGVNMDDLIKYFKSIGVTNAINFDGGGSATFVVNDTVVNYPSDECPGDHRDLCPRKVSTIICVRGERTIKLPEKVESLGYCCNRNYLLVVALTALIGVSLLLHVHFYTLYQFNRTRVRNLLSGQQQKEALQSLLSQADDMSSGFDTDDDEDEM